MKNIKKHKKNYKLEIYQFAMDSNEDYYFIELKN